MELPKKLKNRMVIEGKSGARARIRRTGKRTREGDLVYRLRHESGVLGNGLYTRDELANSGCVLSTSQEWKHAEYKKECSDLHGQGQSVKDKIRNRDKGRASGADDGGHEAPCKARASRRAAQPEVSNEARAKALLLGV